MKIGDRNITMRRGWIAQFNDGSIVCEDDMPWMKVSKKKNIVKMMLKWEDRIWSIENKRAYTVPKKRAFIDVNLGGSSQGIHSRTIGYYDTEKGGKVIMRVEEATGKMTYETE